MTAMRGPEQGVDPSRQLTFPNTATRVLSMYGSFSITLQGQAEGGVSVAWNPTWGWSWAFLPLSKMKALS